MMLFGAIFYFSFYPAHFDLPFNLLTRRRVSSATGLRQGLRFSSLGLRFTPMGLCLSTREVFVVWVFVVETPICAQRPKTQIRWLQGGTL